MKAIVQRTLGRTSIAIKDSENRLSECEFSGPGLVVLLGWLSSDEGRSDLGSAEDWILSRIQGLRIFPDAQGRMNLSLDQYCAENGLKESGILWVSQFTLAAGLESGFRPSFISAMKPDSARLRFEKFQQKVLSSRRAERNIFGIFGADMTLSFSNWGPVTIPLER